MNRLWITVLGCALWTAPAIAQNTGRQNAQPRLNTLRDKASYSIGLSIGEEMAQEGLDLSPALIGRGIADAMQKRTRLLKPEEVQAAMEAFQKQMAARQNALSEKAQAAGAAFLAKNKQRRGVTTLPSGLQYEILKAGNGPRPKKTDTVRTHYHGTLIDGTVFDSSLKRGPAKFGVGQVIPGWTEALLLMPVGSKWKLFVPSNLAYGQRGAGGKIGPNATLVFEVELLGIEK